MTIEELEIVDGLQLSPALRDALRPGEPLASDDGTVHRLPRYFYSVPTWEQARETWLTQHFRLSELMTVDCREADLLLHDFPHFVPCGIVLLGRYLEDFRRICDGPVFIRANGGYRSPAHQWTAGKTPHCWGMAADLYRVGDLYLDDEKSITRYASLAADLGAPLLVRPYADGDDHLHIDLGYLAVTPRHCNEA